MATALKDSHSSSRYDKSDNYICECGRKCISQTDLEQHKLNDCKNRLLQCSFCQEPQSSSTALRDHLMTCGNKTDECPSCRKFIRRAIFAYHYENNCANLEETDTPPRSRNSSAHRPSSKSNKSASRKNDLNDHNQENNNDYDYSNYRTKVSDRILSATSNKRSSLDIVECEFCKNQCTRSDYEAHKEGCLQNPINLNKKRQRTSSTSNKTEPRPSSRERHRSPDIVYLPCEFCNEQIDLRLWSTHVKECQEREIRRIEVRAETINREPVIEKLSCEYCEELCSVERLETHEIICRKNPENIARAAKLSNAQPLPTVGLSNRPLKIDRDPTLSSTYSSLPLSFTSAYNYSPRTKDNFDQTKDILDRTKAILDRTKDREHSPTLHNERFSSQVTVDIKGAQESMRSHANNASALAISEHQPRKQHKAIDDSGSQLINTSRDVPAYDTLSLLSNDRLLSVTQSLPRRLRSAASLERTSFDRQSEDRRPMPRRAAPPSTYHLRSQSASRGFLDERGSHRSNATKPTSHLLLNDHVIFHSPRQEDQTYQPKLNQPDRSVTNNKKSKWKPSLLQPPMKF